MTTLTSFLAFLDEWPEKLRPESQASESHVALDFVISLQAATLQHINEHETGLTRNKCHPVKKSW